MDSGALASSRSRGTSVGTCSEMTCGASWMRERRPSSVETRSPASLHCSDSSSRGSSCMQGCGCEWGVGCVCVRILILCVHLCEYECVHKPTRGLVSRGQTQFHTKGKGLGHGHITICHPALWSAYQSQHSIQSHDI